MSKWASVAYYGIALYHISKIGYLVHQWDSNNRDFFFAIKVWLPNNNAQGIQSVTNPSFLNSSASTLHRQPMHSLLCSSRRQLSSNGLASSTRGGPGMSCTGVRTFFWVSISSSTRLVSLSWILPANLSKDTTILLSKARATIPTGCIMP